MLKQEKERVVAELTERLRDADTLIVADYRGLSVTDIDKLRTDLLAHGARFSVVKNTLTRRAAEAAGTTELLALLEGPTAIAFLESEGDPVAVAKALNEAAKGEVLTLKGGLLQGTTMTADSVKELASLPPVDTLRAQLAGAILSPLTTVVMLLAAPLHDLVGLIDARIRQLEEQGDTSATEAESVAEEPAEEPAAEEPAAEPPVRDSGPGEGVSGEPGGAPGADQEPAAEATESEESTETTEDQEES
jgi:large subunit ribosomal protein L10